MHPRRLLAVLGVVVLTSMTSCTSFSSSRSSSMDKTGWITAVAGAECNTVIELKLEHHAA